MHIATFLYLLLTGMNLFRQTKSFTTRLRANRPRTNTVKMSTDIPTTMKAVICEKHGEKLKISQVPVPVPKDDEILVKIRASGICHTDLHVCSGDLKGILPVCPGHEGAGNFLLSFHLCFLSLYLCPYHNSNI